MKEKNKEMKNISDNPHLHKNAVISSCDCLVGFLSGEKVNKSTIDYEVESIVNIQPTFKKYELLNGEPQSKRQIVETLIGYCIYTLLANVNYYGIL